MGAMLGGMASPLISSLVGKRRNVVVQQPQPQQPQPQPAALASLLGVLEPMCVRGFLRQVLRQVTALCTASKELAMAAPMGTATQIFEASGSGNDAALTTFLAFWDGNSESSTVLNQRSASGVTSLHAAVENNRLACVLLLVANAPAVDVNKRSARPACAIRSVHYITSPLQIASERGFAPIVGVLGAVPGIDLNVQTDCGNSALHMAALQGHAEVVRALVSLKGIEIDVGNAKGKTPLELTQKGRHYATAAILTEAIERRQRLDAAGLEVFRAAFHNNMAQLSRLVERWSGDADGADVLDWVFVWGVEDAEDLDDEDEPMEAPGWDGLTAVMAASMQGNIGPLELLLATPGVDLYRISEYREFSILSCASICNRLAAVRVILRTIPNINVNHEESNTETALLHAARGSVEMVRDLLKVDGIDVNRVNRFGQTPLTYAIRCTRVNNRENLLEIVRLLIAAPDININCTTKFDFAGFDQQHPGGGTALDLADVLQETDIAALLRAAGAKTSAELEATVLPV